MSGDHPAPAPMVMMPAPGTTKAGSDRFTGDVWVDAITGGAGPAYARLATVRFAPGARTAWHCHGYGIDLYLIDQPLGDYYSSWRAMQNLHGEGVIKAIGRCPSPCSIEREPVLDQRDRCY